MKFSELWQRHKLPIVATGSGLLVAFVLGVAPTLTPPPQPRATPVATAPVAASINAPSSDEMAALSARMDALEASTAQRLGALETRLSTIEKASVRNFARIRALQEQTSGFADLSGAVRNLDAHVSTLNKAVPRLSQRLRGVSEAPILDPAYASSVRALEARVDTLDKAVVRLATKLREMPATAGGEDISEQIEAMSDALSALANSLER